ncbi:MAG: 2OG-Fe(II) oxygenase [Deltaproteobacteria bacterium]|nr:2OG-Fe(II) oxygenase [Deltaproteobacteria bacterium]
MSLDALKTILEQLPDPSYVEGTAKLSERFAIALPDGDVGALDDKRFVDWLLEHAEAAPFGDHGETKLDPKVRHAKRLVARSKAVVAGFDPAGVLPAIEAALSPRFHLDAKLEDVTVYETGGKFARHKDTPRTANLVGTLVVGLPIAHEGGAFSIVDAGQRHDVDWSGTPDPSAVRWVALFSDVDHSVEQVKAGARVTLVYSLSRSDRPRADAARDDKLASLRKAVGALTIPKAQPLMIACTRQIVTDGTQPQSIDTLRGTDREIADTFADSGFDVAVRACIVGDNEEGGDPGFPDTQHMYAITRLSKAIPDSVVAGMDEAVSFTDAIDAEEYEEEGDEPMGGTLLGEYVLDMVAMDRWVIRTRAAASVIYEGMYSETGYFGNEASMGHIYTLAAIEVTTAKR